MSSLDPHIEKELREVHDKLASQGELLSTELVKTSLETFQSRFGPDRLRSLDGPELLQLMHTHGNHDSLVYWLEYKDDDEFKGRNFGIISGGGAHMYGIFRRKGSQQWVKGIPRSEENITEAEAVIIARKHRDQLIASAELLKSLPKMASDAEYLALQKALEDRAPDLATKGWVHKYLFLNFPDKLDDFHTERLRNYHLIKILQEPPKEAGLYVSAGCYIRLATGLGWPVYEFTKTLNERSGGLTPYWRVGTRLGGKVSIWNDMKNGGYIAVGWSKIGDLSEYVQNGDLKEKKAGIVLLQEANYPGAPPNISSRQSGELLNFVATISEGEIVIAGDGEKVLGIGRVTGKYYYESTSLTEAPHRHPVEWLSFDQWDLPIKDGPRTTVWELKKNRNLLEIEKRIQGAPPIILLPKSHVKSLDGAKPRLNGIPARIHAILERKGQAILYGPPGTGKTYWARQTAFDLAALGSYNRRYNDLSDAEKVAVVGSDTIPGLVRCCTFHPAYGYEDFLEGYRPERSPGGQLTFLLRTGIFKQICEDARNAPETQKFILLIDEINRGDIPRIFGELLTLLELDKRGTSISLPLSGERFHVPKNVYVLGTMNTADRSIALLDTALRRRFGFIELMPDIALLTGAVVEGRIPLGAWLNALNERIREHMGREGRNLQIGHAYLMKGGKPVTDFSTFMQILAEDLVPLLEEYCYEDYSALSRILGNGLVDEQRQCIREELFKPARREDLIQAILSTSPDIVTTMDAFAFANSVDENAGTESEDTES